MKNQTKLVIVLDRSGSMQLVVDSMNEVLNGYITMQKAQPGDCVFTLVQFDDKYETVVHNLDIRSAPQFTLVPRGGTALLDAIGKTIDDTGKELAALPEHERPDKVLVVIVTDGQENTSREYDLDRINRMVSTQRDVYNWQFIFLGADQDAIANACKMGFTKGQTVNYISTSAGIKGMGAKLSTMSSCYRAAPTARAGSESVRDLAEEAPNNEVTKADTKAWDAMMAVAGAMNQQP